MLDYGDRRCKTMLTQEHCLRSSYMHCFQRKYNELRVLFALIDSKFENVGVLLVGKLVTDLGVSEEARGCLHPPRSTQ